MNAINPNKASDIYKIKPEMIKDMTPFLAPLLTILFNKAIDEDRYPDSLKFTKVIEIYKKKDKTLPVNYRPISLLPIIAKILDTVINKQLMKHLLTHNLISSTQYAFRPHSSTTLALQTIINSIRKQVSKHNPTLAIYIDLSKAYDTISHKKLMHKLKHEFNFTAGTLTFFNSYFQGREQSTHTQNAQSQTQTITHGIPQGSTLSTTLFLLYINNILDTVPNSKVYTYADDTTLVITTESFEDLQQLAQTELNSLIQYFHTNNLVPNHTKTNYTVFFPITHQPQEQAPLPQPQSQTQEQQQPQPQTQAQPQAQPLPPTLRLHINNITIKQNIQAPLLGIIIGNKLKHHQSISKIVKKLQPVIQQLRYTNNFVPQRTMRDLYYTHVFPHLIGSISIWGTDDGTKTYIQPLIRTQKKIIRIIARLRPRTHTKPLMTRLKILSIINLFTLRVSIEIQPFIHHTNTANRPEHIHAYTRAAQIHDYPTRFSHQQQKLSIHFTEYFTEIYTKVWNKLPLELRAIKSLAIFKRRTKEYLLQQQNV
jgi:hypothetical protein